ncbi:restriction endonuclease subunit S [Apilactobacillus kunkeei]|uniref:restriction endonuclease subunit S n=1 Tax=Apilactobacillus kunkeei TaxID=148814 RepID=UPI00200ACB19|nr:restriction endonuclease subunit S [Apilactobacillus kunkeei]MCK8618134.1 restriction endonuclease subunit S [Apilactobacillus kunkeei]
MTKTNVPRLRFNEFIDEWDTTKFGNLYKKNFEKNEINFDKSKTISISKMKFNKEGNGADYSSLKSYKVLRVGDIAFEGHKNKNFEFGRFVLNDIGDGIMSPRFTSLRPIKNQYIPFMKYLVHLEKIIRPILVKSTKAGTMMNELVVSDLLKQNINIPSYKEQQKIGSFIAKIDNLIELQTKKLEQLKKLKQGYLQKMFPQDGESVPRLRFSGFSGDWKEDKLKETLKVGKSGGTPSTKNKEYYDGTIPFLSIKDVTESNGIINDTEKHINNDAIQNSSSWIVPKGSLTISMYASIGSVAKFSSDVATSQAFFNMIFNDGIDVDFMYHFFNQYNLMGRWKRLIATGTQGNLNATEINNILVRIPSEEEQLKIASLLSKLDQVINDQSKKIEVLKQQKKAYLQKMFL